MGVPQRRAWNDLKLALSNPETLAAIRRVVDKKIMTDASAYILGGILLQKTDDGK